MARKMMLTAAALVGAALLALPMSPSYAGMDEVSAQAGTKGAGAPQTGTGPGTDRGNPSVTNDTGPGANPITPAPRKRTVKKASPRHGGQPLKPCLGADGAGLSGVPAHPPSILTASVAREFTSVTRRKYLQNCPLAG